MVCADFDHGVLLQGVCSMAALQEEEPQWWRDTHVYSLILSRLLPPQCIDVAEFLTQIECTTVSDAYSCLSVSGNHAEGRYHAFCAIKTKCC